MSFTISNFAIKNFLHSYDKETKRGTCSKCNRSVPWSFAALKSHKKGCGDEAYMAELKAYLEKREKEMESTEGKDIGKDEMLCQRFRSEKNFHNFLSRGIIQPLLQVVQIVNKKK